MVKLLNYGDKAKLTPLTEIKPYKRNPRKNERAVAMVQRSIEEYGFLQPIVCDKDGVIIAGHTRYKAAKNLGLTEAPVIFAENLTAEQAKAFRLVDNKSAELADWSQSDLIKEIEEIEKLNYDIKDFGFEHWEDMHARAQWSLNERRSDLKKDVKLREKSGFLYASLFRTSKTGDTLLEIKENRDNAEPFGYCLIDFIRDFFGENLDKGEYCICTAPARRHKEHNFAEEICKMAAEKLNIPFCPGIFAAEDKKRFGSEITLAKEPAKQNVIWFDDIMTTGSTAFSCRSLLTGKGYNVFVIIGIRCQ